MCVAIKAGVAIGVLLGLIVAAASLAAALYCTRPHPPSASKAPQRGCCTCCATEVITLPSGTLPRVHIGVAAVAALLAFLALLTPWLIETTAVATVLVLLEHIVCRGAACSSSANVVIIDSEESCYGDSACLAEFNYTHIATVFATAGAAFALAALVVAIARPHKSTLRAAIRAVVVLHVTAALLELVAWSVYGDKVFPTIAQSSGRSLVAGPGLVFAAIASLLSVTSIVLAAVVYYQAAKLTTQQVRRATRRTVCAAPTELLMSLHRLCAQRALLCRCDPILAVAYLTRCTECLLLAQVTLCGCLQARAGSALYPAP